MQRFCEHAVIVSLQHLLKHLDLETVPNLLLILKQLSENFTFLKITTHPQQ
jgi:hypothetical protein